MKAAESDGNRRAQTSEQQRRKRPGRTWIQGGVAGRKESPASEGDCSKVDDHSMRRRKGRRPPVQTGRLENRQ